MKVTFEVNVDGVDGRDDVETLIKALPSRIALWDTDKMFRNAIKYEGFMRDNEYLTDEEEAVVEKLYKKFYEILDEHDIKNHILEMP